VHDEVDVKVEEEGEEEEEEEEEVEELMEETMEDRLVVEDDKKDDNDENGEEEEEDEAEDCVFDDGYAAIDFEYTAGDGVEAISCIGSTLGRVPSPCCVRDIGAGVYARV
jgi:vacuolar-type H+-ATPase subunit I/STV1